jgi:hypothetical protein
MNQGFVLIYTILLIDVILIITSITFTAVQVDIRNSRDVLESMKAYYAADTGIECVKYYQKNFQVFDTSKPATTYSCGVGSFTAGAGTTVCETREYPQFRLNLPNGACTIVQVKTTQRTININGVPTPICDYLVISNGRNSCTATLKTLTERTRWENL